MKSLIILLFVPFIGFSQITFKDIMRINSVDKFKRIVIENGYEYDSRDGDFIIYGLNLERDSIKGNKAVSWGFYNIKNNGFAFNFNKEGIFGKIRETSYDLIVREIKNKCKYYAIKRYKETDYVTYSCSESSYKGKIGFVISEGTGVIRHFPK